MQYMNTFHDQGEKPSTYLHRLQVVLNLTVHRGGVQLQEVDKHLLKQFYRGCWDNGLLAVLQLDLKKHNLPSFAELLQLVHTAGDRQEAKNTRIKRHLSVMKQTAGESQAECDSHSINKLKKQVADMNSQLTLLVKERKTTTAKRKQSEKPEIKKT